VGRDHRPLDVGRTLQVAAASHDELRLAVLHVAAARRAVRAGHRVDQLFQRETAGAKARGIETTPIMGIPSIDTGVFGGIIVGLIAAKAFNRFYKIQLPSYLGFFAGNDFFDADPYRKRIVLNKYFLDIDKRYEHRLLGYPLVARSRLWLFLKNKLEFDDSEKVAKQEGEQWSAATGQPLPFQNIPLETYRRTQRARLEFFNKRTSAERFGANTRFIFESIEQMNELLKAKGIKFMVAIYPDEFQVNPTQLDTLVSQFQLTKEDYDLNLAQNLLKTFLESKQIPCLDMTDDFRNEERQRELYLFRNTHWNDAGNQLAADTLFQYLLKQPYDFNSLR
jgi:hypothetical protein